METPVWQVMDDDDQGETAFVSSFYRKFPSQTLSFFLYNFITASWAVWQLLTERGVFLFGFAGTRRWTPEPQRWTPRGRGRSVQSPPEEDCRAAVWQAGCGRHVTSPEDGVVLSSAFFFPKKPLGCSAPEEEQTLPSLFASKNKSSLF